MILVLSVLVDCTVIKVILVDRDHTDYEFYFHYREEVLIRPEDS